MFIDINYHTVVLNETQKGVKKGQTMTHLQEEIKRSDVGVRPV
jgi:hypothetical protein